jgi:hypothetical protein
MPYRRWLALAVIALTAHGSASAQEPAEPLEVVVLSPRDLPVKRVAFTIDGDTRHVVFDADGRATETFRPRPRGVKIALSFRVEEADNALMGAVWITNVLLNGSGHLEYQLLANGRGRSRQWPIVTWLSSGARLDVGLNDGTIGSTRLLKGVAPAKRHRSEWRSGGRAACTHEFTLDYNVERTFECDPATGKVTER